MLSVQQGMISVQQGMISVQQGMISLQQGMIRVQQGPTGSVPVLLGLACDSCKPLPGEVDRGRAS